MQSPLHLKTWELQRRVPPLQPPVYVKERLNEARHRLSLVQERKKDTCIDWQWKNIEDTITRSVQMKLFQKQTTQYHSWMPAWTHLGKAFIFPAVTNEVVELFDLKGLSVPRFGAGLLHSGEIPALTGYMTKMVFKKECFNFRRWQKGSKSGAFLPQFIWVQDEERDRDKKKMKKKVNLCVSAALHSMKPKMQCGCFFGCETLV